jgi:hypothetical protein
VMARPVADGVVAAAGGAGFGRVGVLGVTVVEQGSSGATAE